MNAEPPNLRGTTLRVVIAFPPGFFDGLSPRLVIEAGDHVRVDLGASSTAWPAFVRVTNDQGRTGWVPRRLLRGSGEGRTVVRPYDTTTLDPALGEELRVVETDLESGWLWCRDSQGRTGWFPVSHLAPVGPGPRGGSRE